MAKRKSQLVKLQNEHPILNYETNQEESWKWFRILNRELFNNSLPPVAEIEIKWRRNVHARYEYEDNPKLSQLERILLNKKYESKKLFVESLAHEMVHHYQWVNKLPVDHGSIFKKMEEFMKKKGLII